MVLRRIEHETAAAETSRAARQEKTFETGAQGQNPIDLAFISITHRIHGAGRVMLT